MAGQHHLLRVLPRRQRRRARGPGHQTAWTGLVADLICRLDPFAAVKTGFWTR
jgi:hypothetical protein